MDFFGYDPGSHASRLEGQWEPKSSYQLAPHDFDFGSSNETWASWQNYFTTGGGDDIDDHFRPVPWDGFYLSVAQRSTWSTIPRTVEYEIAVGDEAGNNRFTFYDSGFITWQQYANNRNNYGVFIPLAVPMGPKQTVWVRGRQQLSSNNDQVEMQIQPIYRSLSDVRNCALASRYEWLGTNTDMTPDQSMQSGVSGTWGTWEDFGYSSGHALYFDYTIQNDASDGGHDAMLEIGIGPAGSQVSIGRWRCEWRPSGIAGVLPPKAVNIPPYENVWVRLSRTGSTTQSHNINVRLWYV